VKATSRAHDKKVALNTSKNYNALQASKPWASPDEISTFNKGRGFPAGRGRGLHMRGSPRSGNVWNPRADNFNSGGSDYGTQNQKNFNARGGRGSFPNNNKSQRGQPSNQFAGYNSGNQGNRAQGFQQKPKTQNKGFRGGGN
jgi:hypothetical protein